MLQHKIQLFFIGLALLGGISPRLPAATQWQDHAAIRVAAQQFLDTYIASQQLGRSEITLGSLDPRLRLKACTTALAASMLAGGRTMGSTTVAVRCKDPGGWKILVAAQVDVFGPVLVARHPLARGSLIQADDLELVERNLSHLPYGYYRDTQPVAGLLAKRTIAATTVITPPMLQAPNLVKRGERVSIVAERGPIQIRTSGKALADGKSGDIVQIRADGSQRVIDGRVVGQGVVKVTL